MAGFSYQFGANPQIDYIRMLIADTEDCNHVFEDEEIQAAYRIQQSVFQSSMTFSPPYGQSLPSQPVSYYRVAALLLDSLASSKARLSGVTKLLDVTVNLGEAAKCLREQAQSWRDLDDNSGAFAIVEQCTTSWSFSDRFFKQIQRQLAQ